MADFQYDRVLVTDWLSEACVHSDERLTLINSGGFIVSSGGHTFL